MTSADHHAEWRAFRARLTAGGVAPDDFSVHAMMNAASVAMAQGITMAEFVGLARDVYVMAKQSSDALAEAEAAPAVDALMAQAAEPRDIVIDRQVVGGFDGMPPLIKDWED